MYTASGDYGHVRVLADEKVVVDQFGQSALAEHHRDVARFVLRARPNIYVYPRFVGLGLYGDILP